MVVACPLEFELAAEIPHDAVHWVAGVVGVVAVRQVLEGEVKLSAEGAE